MARKARPAAAPVLAHTTHPTADRAAIPDVGIQPQFPTAAPKQRYRYDDSLSPALDYDGQNHARELGEALIREIEEATSLEQAKAAAAKLKALGRPFLNWAGKAERLSFEVDTPPLFVHERLSTKAIIESLSAHQKPGRQRPLFDLYGDPRRSIADQQLKAYQHRDLWTNRLILGDSLTVMNSLLHLERMAGQVQMIYMDPPYGVKYGSNFQPFVRSRDVSHSDDEDMTREPEMVQAYRDTWEIGIHSYLTYLRDRLTLCRELLHPSGSIFVQINDKNVHHVRAVLDEVFGKDNFVSQINFQSTTGFETRTLATLGDYLLWYGRDASIVKVRKVYYQKQREVGEVGANWLLLPDGAYRGVSATEKCGETSIPAGAKLYAPDNLIGQGAASEPQPFEFKGNVYLPGPNAHWKASYPDGMKRLAAAGRIHAAKNSLRYRRFVDDFPYAEYGNLWTDTVTGSFTAEKLYVVQTNTKVIQRCVQMTTDPGDLVLDPTCGSGTTAYVAEQWGRRWITIDVSRVPLALTRQRLLSASFDWYELKDDARGPAGGFAYKRKQNRHGEEIGGIVPHVTLRSIANGESPGEEVLVDRPEVVGDIVRVVGPFTVEGTIAPVAPVEEQPAEQSADVSSQSFPDRMLAILRKSPRLALAGNRYIEFAKARIPAKSQHINAEAELVNGKVFPVAVVFGPENGAVSEKLVFSAAREAYGKNYVHLVVIGFAIEAKARQLIDTCEQVCGISATYAQATLDVMMGNLLKNMKSSQILSVCGSPDIEVKRIAGTDGRADQYQVELLAVDAFNPVTMEVHHRKGNDVPAWFLCEDYDDMVFRIHQAFFPRTGAWDNLKRALRGSYEDSMWEHLAGTTSAPFEAGERRKIAVKVIDDRGNELMVVRDLDAKEGGAR